MTWCAGSGKKDTLLCWVSRMSLRTVQRLFRLPFHFRLPQPLWRHRKRNKGDRSRSDFNACIARSPSGNLHTFGTTSGLILEIDRFVVSFATKRSPSTQTCGHTREFTRGKNHLSATIVTRASHRRWRYEVTQELTQVTGLITVSGAASRLLVFPGWKDITGFTRTPNKMNWKFHKKPWLVSHPRNNSCHSVISTVHRTLLGQQLKSGYGFVWPSINIPPSPPPYEKTLRQLPKEILLL